MRHETSSSKLRSRARSRPALVRGESGQVLILMALAMFVILGVAAFALDEAQLSVAHHQAQLAADSGALSAAQDLETTTIPTTTVNNDGTTAATQNDPNSTVTVSEPTGVQAKATVSAPVTLPFGKMFGLGNGSVKASAVASVSQSTTSIDGQILGINCPGDDTNPCEYDAGASIPTSSQTDGWQVTKTAEDPTTAYTPSGGTAGETTVNIQTCNGTQGSGACYQPNSTTADQSGDLTQVVDLNGDSEGGMWQTVTTVPDAKYVLTFWLTGNPALNGWPTGANNYFPLDVYVTAGSGSSAQYTPSVTESVSNPGTSSIPDPCTDSSDQAPNQVACGWWDYSDPVCSGSSATTASPQAPTGLSLSCSTNGQEEAYFTIESLSFTATSTSTTITFNSEVYDNDAKTGGDGWFYCGPEVADITFGPPAIQLSQ